MEIKQTPKHIIKAAMEYEPAEKEKCAVFNQMDDSQIEMMVEKQSEISRIRWVLPFHPMISRLPIARITNQISEKWLGSKIKIEGRAASYTVLRPVARQISLAQARFDIAYFV